MIAMLAVFALIASAIPVAKLGLTYLSPLLFIGIKMIAGGGMLFGWQKYKRSEKLSWAVLRQDALFLLSFGFLFTFVPTLLKMYALKHLVSSHAVFFKSFGPFITAFYAFVFFNERLSFQKICAMLLGVCAFCVLFSASISSLSADLFLPMAAGFGAIALIKLRWILMQDRLRNSGYSPSDLNAISMIGAGVLALVSTYLFEGATCFVQLRSCLDWKVGGIIAYGVIVGTILTYNFYGYCLKQYSATFMSLTQLLLPVYVSILGYFFLNEQITLHFFVSTILMLVGLALFYMDEVSLKFKRPAIF